jgi:hypothetical protein
MSERVIRQRNIIHQLKEEKQGRIRAQQALEGTYIAPILSMITYGKTHFVSLLERAPPVNRRMLEQQENRRLRRAGRRRLREQTINPQAQRCSHCLHDNCEPHSRRSSLLCHAHIYSMKEIMQNTLGPDHQIGVRKASLLQSLHVMGRSRSKEED